MAWNGSGIFNRLYNWVTDKVNLIPITASRMDAEFDNFKVGLQNCMTLDGQTLPTSTIGFNSQNINNINGITYTGTLTGNVANLTTSNVSGVETVTGILAANGTIVMGGAVPAIYSKHPTDNGLAIGSAGSNSYALFRLAINSTTLAPVNSRHPIVINQNNNHISFGGRITVQDDSASNFAVVEFGDSNTLLYRDSNSNVYLSMLASKAFYQLIGGTNYRVPIIQAGAASVTNSPGLTAISFPTAFPGAPHVVITSEANFAVSATSITASGFNANNSSGFPLSCHWIAVY